MDRIPNQECFTCAAETRYTRLVKICLHCAVEAVKYKWESVKDSLPKTFKRVLVYRANYSGDSDNQIMVGYLNQKEQFRGVQGELIDDDLYPHTLVTHWMPLPSAPEIENGE